MRILMIILVSALVYGCVQEDIKKNSAGTQVESREDDDPGEFTLYSACWSEWGVASKNCDGWGLCNFNDCWIWNDDFPCCTSDNATLIVNNNTTSSSQHMLEIHLDINKTKQVTAYSNNSPLVIEQSITDSIQIPNYNTITIPADTIMLDSSLGKNG